MASAECSKPAQTLRWWLGLFCCLSFLAHPFFPAEAAAALETIPDEIVRSQAVGGPRVWINEFMAANVNGLRDEDGSAEDWLELFNDGDAPVELGGWALTDETDYPGQWVFPPTLLPGKGCLVIFASGKNRKTGPNLHTNFKLRRSGEYLGLFNAETPRRAVSEFGPAYPEQRNDYSYGRTPSGGWSYFSQPTPGAGNGDSGIHDVVAPVYFSVKRGFFERAFHLSLHTATPEAVIRFTLDGSEPTETSGLAYDGWVRIDGTRTVRAAAFKPNSLPSLIETHTYVFLHPKYLQGVSAISLVTASNHLFGPAGIMEINPRNTTNHGIAWERPVSVELIRPGDNQGFQVDAGLRVAGGDYIRERYDYRTRQLPEGKYSFQLRFRGDYGQGKLNYPLIPGIPLQSFDELVVRAGMNDPNNPFLRDEFVRALSAATGIVASHGTFALLYLNGVYQGIYNPAERISSRFLQAWLGGGADWDVLEQLGQVREGDDAAWNALFSLAEDQDPASPEVYQQIQNSLDVQNFIDYLLPHIYAATDDWPGNNWRAARERTPSGKFRFYTWDAEWSFGYMQTYSVSHDPFTEQFPATDYPGAFIERLFTRLYRSQEFRLLFADRMHAHFFNGGALTDESIRATYDRLKNQIEPLYSGQFNDTIGTDWIPYRRDYVLTHSASAGLLASSNAPVFHPFGGRVPRDFHLTMQAGSGTIWFTTNGVDPRAVFTGQVEPGSFRYTAPIRFGQSTQIKARTLSGTNWSALSEAIFQVEQIGIPLRITELMYHPPGGTAFEFIELQNIGTVPLHLAGMTFEGVTCRFRQDSPPLAPGAFLVLASDVDLAAFLQRYPGVQPFATYSGSLSNDGELVAIRDATGKIVTMVRYEDSNGWPGAADNGYSLELVDPYGDQSSPGNWKRSAAIGGSPGRQNSPWAPSPVRLNEFFAGGLNAEAGSDWVELHNYSTAPANLAGWSFTDNSNPRRFVFPAETSISPNGYLVIWCGGPGSFPGLNASFGLAWRGETIRLFDAQTNEVDAITFGFQVASHACGRTDPGGEWTLTLPSPGARNEPATLSSNVKINEVFANPPPGGDDWFELHNADPVNPAAVGRLHAAISGAVSQLPGLSFIPPGGFLQIFADERPGTDHLGLRLPASGGTLVLMNAAGTELDRVSYGFQQEGTSAGRLPDGSGEFTELGSPTPGVPNYQPEYSGPRLSEVLARASVSQDNTGRIADWLEIFNPSDLAAELGGMALAIDQQDANAWRFPSGTLLPPKGFLRIWCDGSRPASIDPAQPFNLGRSLPDHGASIYLFGAAGQRVDWIEYGPQLLNLSVGGVGGSWNLLAAPTPEQPNASAALLGSKAAVRLNEWLASTLSGDEWLELYNPEPLPVQIGGLMITDDPSVVGMTKAQLAELSFIAPGGFVVLQADGETSQGPEHLPFRLNARGETLRIYDGASLVDEIAFAAQTRGVSEGRVPDGGVAIASFPGRATPGSANASDSLDQDGDGMPDQWETAYGFNVADPADAAWDADGDGMSNLDEFRAGTNPLDPESFLAFEQMVVEGNGSIVLVFRAAAERSYSVLRTESLVEPNWKRIENVPAGPAGVVQVRDTATEMPAARFYRILTPALP